MEFKTCVLGPATDFLPPGAPAVGTFQTWSNAKVGGERRGRVRGMHGEQLTAGRNNLPLVP